MPGRVDITIDVKDLEVGIRRYDKKIRAFPMSAIAEILATAIDDVIELEGMGTWPDFAPATLKRWPKRAGGSLLQKTGLLANIQKSHGPDWGQAESPAPYSWFHHTGTKHMPKRDFLDVGMDRVLDDIGRIVLSEVV